MSDEEIKELYEMAQRQWTAALRGDVHLFNIMNNPNIGDLAMESTAGALQGPNHIGFILAISYSKSWPIYHILTMKTKEVVTWGNCKWVKMPNNPIYEYEEYKQIANKWAE